MVAIEWILLQPSAIKRLNICDGSIVHPQFLESTEFIGRIDHEVLNVLYNLDEINTMSWIWKLKKVNYSSKIYIFVYDVTHHIRFSDSSGLHYEKWLFGLFECNDGVYRLAPLKRTSDCDFNKLEYLKEHGTTCVERVWLGCGYK